MDKYLVLTTGGTIASINTDHGLKPQVTGQELLEYVPDVKGNCDIDVIQVCNIDSTNVSLKVWQDLVSIIEDKYEDYDGFLILHGTDTLAYSAAALSYMIQNSNKPIILTGSQRPISYDSTDAIENLRDSFAYMQHKGTRGVKIVFGGKVIAGTRAKKVNTLSYQAFNSINYPFVAAVRNKQVIEYIGHAPYEDKLRIYSSLSTKVFVLKLTPNIDKDIIEFIYEKYDGIIIEGFGVGGVPSKIFDILVSCQNKYPKGKKLLVLTTQVIAEGAHISIYEVGKQLEGKCNYLEARDMNIEAVVAKVMWILGLELDEFNTQKELFYHEINHDILGK